jgi:hypothetical protein
VPCSLCRRPATHTSISGLRAIGAPCRDVLSIYLGIVARVSCLFNPGCCASPCLVSRIVIRSLWSSGHTTCWSSNISSIALLHHPVIIPWSWIVDLQNIGILPRHRSWDFYPATSSFNIHLVSNLLYPPCWRSHVPFEPWIPMKQNLLLSRFWNRQSLDDGHRRCSRRCWLQSCTSCVRVEYDWLFDGLFSSVISEPKKQTVTWTSELRSFGAEFFWSEGNNLNKM